MSDRSNFLRLSFDEPDVDAISVSLWDSVRSRLRTMVGCSWLALNIGWFNFKCRFWGAVYRACADYPGTILLRVTTMMRGTDLVGPPVCRLAEWSTDWGCSLQPNLLRVVTTSEWIVLIDLFDFRLSCWSKIEVDFVTRTHFKWSRSL